MKIRNLFKQILFILGGLLTTIGLFILTGFGILLDIIQNLNNKSITKITKKNNELLGGIKNEN